MTGSLDLSLPPIAVESSLYGQQQTATWNEEERAEAIEVSTRALGAALMDTLIASEDDDLEALNEVSMCSICRYVDIFYPCSFLSVCLCLCSG